MKCENCGYENVEIITKQIGYSCGHCGRNTELMEELRPKTNFDRIHAMNMEELAEWLADVTDSCLDCGYSQELKKCPFIYCRIDSKAFLDWLQSEVEE